MHPRCGMRANHYSKRAFASKLLRADHRHANLAPRLMKLWSAFGCRKLLTMPCCQLKLATASQQSQYSSSMTLEACASCGSADVGCVDFVLACRQCGFEIDDAPLVPPFTSPDTWTGSFKVTEAGPVLDIVAEKAWPSLRSMATEAAACSSDMHLPDSVAQAALQAVQSYMLPCALAASRVLRPVAVAVVLCVAARLASYPLALRSICAHLHAPVSPALRLLSLVMSKTQHPFLPHVSVRVCSAVVYRMCRAKDDICMQSVHSQPRVSSR